jgi:hypothetical protein
VLLVDVDERKLRLLSQILRPMVRGVETRTSLADLSGLEGMDLVIIGYDQLSPPDRDRMLRLVSTRDPRMRLLFWSEGKCQVDFATLFGSRAITNLLASGERFDAAELIVTVNKILSQDIFGIEKYFTWGVHPQVSKFTRSEQKAELIDGAREFATHVGAHPRLVGLYCTVADEFITNAIYNAPVDSARRPRFTHFARTEPVSLSEGEEIELKLCSDGHRLGLSIADPFGSLTTDRVMDYLARSFRKGPDQVEQKPGGAGLGFYYVFESLTQFVINLHPGRRTEMVGLIDIRGTYRDFATHAKSFNVFVAN